MALNIFSVPSSAGPVERAFSYSGLACLGRRDRLTGANLEREVLMNKNRKLLDVTNRENLLKEHDH